MMKIETRDNAAWLSVKVVPNSSRTQIAGQLGDALKIKVAQPPEDGRANRAVEGLLAAVLHVPLSNVSVVSGQTRPLKVVRVAGITAETAVSLLSKQLPKK
jgi:uncharacterized protein (TIGR00251 family)